MKLKVYKGLTMEQRDRNEYGDGVILWMFSLFFFLHFLTEMLGILYSGLGEFQRVF